MNSKLKNRLDKATKRFEYLTTLKSELEHNSEQLQNKLQTNKQALEVLYDALYIVQSTASSYFDDVVTEAFKAVFSSESDNVYAFKSVFSFYRSKLKCEFAYERDGNQYDPLRSCGFGYADIASTVLRMAYVVLTESAPVIIADEPLKHLSEDNQALAAKVLSRLCSELGLQLILSTHSKEFLVCDKIEKYRLRGVK